MVMLRDTEAAQSLMLPDAAPVTADCRVGAKALIEGMNSGYVSVPLVRASGRFLVRVNLKSDMVTGEVTVGNALW